MSDLPIGVHPQDARGAETGVLGGAAPLNAQTGDTKRNFGTSNADALGVYQRSAHSVACRTIYLSAHQSGTAQIVGRLKGRQSVMIWVPSAEAVGVMISEERGVLEGVTGGIQLYPGDSITIYTEAALNTPLQHGHTTRKNQNKKT